MRKRAWWLAAVVVAGAALAAPAPDANVKKWQDEQGVWHYGDARPAAPDSATNTAADAYRRGDYVVAFREYMVWAKQGDPKAQTMIGQMYLRGEGIGSSQTNAIEWFRRAALQNNVEAQLQLAMLYAANPGLAPSEKEALLWLRKAAGRGNAEAQYPIRENHRQSLR